MTSLGKTAYSQQLSRPAWQGLNRRRAIIGMLKSGIICATKHKQCSLKGAWGLPMRVKPGGLEPD